MKILVFVIAYLISCGLYAGGEKLAVTAIFQNEADYLEEWIDYHESIGVNKFLLYNNNSTDGFRDILSPYVEKGLVELIEWPSYQEENDWWHFSFVVQTGAYNDALARTRGEYKWLAIIDTDEFIIPIDYSNLVEFLEDNYSNASGLCVNWQCYGTSGIEKAPKGQLLNLLTYKMRWDHDWNKHSKSIVQPLHVSHCPNPHLCVYNPGHWAVNSDRVRTDACCTYVNIDKIRINHYWTRDEWFFWNVKIARYQRWGQDISGTLHHAKEMNEVYDPILIGR